MKIAKLKDRKITLINIIKVVKIDLIFTEEEMCQIKQGFTPKEMEDKWLICYEDGKLYFFRSWTGFEIFRLSIDKVDNEYRVSEFFVESNNEKYTNTDKEKDKSLVESLINNFLLKTDK